MHLIFRTSVVLLLATFAARAEESRDLSCSSPDGRWKIIARWVSDNDPDYGGHYTYEFQAKKSGKSYLEETDTGKDVMHPHDFSAYWSPTGRYVAINLYYGKIDYEVVMFDVSGGRPREIPLFPEKMTDYGDFQTSADKWLDDASLEVEAYQPVNWSATKTETTYNLVIRFEKDVSSVVKKKKE